MPNVSKQYHDQLQQQIKEFARQIQSIYYDTIVEVSLSSSLVKYYGKPFNFDLYPQLKRKVDKIIEKMFERVFATVTNSIEQGWSLSNTKNDLVFKTLIGDRSLSTATKGIVYNPNAAALIEFTNRVTQGLTLSNRVWNRTKVFRHEVEAGMADAIAKGEGAAQLASKLKRFLKQPDRLFRRVRDKNGVLQLSRAARQYSPGQGVYRSSYQNALRLTATETNMAYRTADHVRWKNQNFVKGVKIALSERHPEYDECDILAGNYPKDFKWVGWHPRCICFATPILISDEEFSKLEDVQLGLTDQAPDIKYIKDIPDKSSQWIKENSKRINGWKNRPYWAKDNPGFVKELLK